jgi:hypothetical protein
MSVFANTMHSTLDHRHQPQSNIAGTPKIAEFAGGLFFTKILTAISRRKIVKDNNEERWMDICNRIAIEQDPQCFTQLIQELQHLLDEKNLRPRGKANKYQVRSLTVQIL